MDLASEPAGEILRGVALLAGGEAVELLSNALQVEVVEAVSEAAPGFAGRAKRFLLEHVLKLLELRGDWLADDIGDKVAEWIHPRNLLVKAARAEGAKTSTQTTIEGAKALDAEAVDALRSDLGHLHHGYVTQTVWIAKSARWLRRGSSLLCVLLASVGGPLALAGVYLVGGGYVVYSLMDRIDARDLGAADLVEGVVRLVTRRLGS